MDLQDKLARMTEVVQQLRMDKILQRDEIYSLRAEARSFQKEINSLTCKTQDMDAQTLQDAAATNVGREVRLRYLELHRQRMGKGTDKVDYDLVKRGNRAAHRGRPVADAWLCLTGLMRGDEVYIDLYGVTPLATQEMMAVLGFRASLHSEGRLTPFLQGLFERLLEYAAAYSSPTELRTAFEEEKALQYCHNVWQDCYDRIVVANHR